MIEPLLKAQLDPVVRRTRRLRLWQSLGWYWFFAAVSATAVLVIGKLLVIATWLPLLAIICVALSGSLWIRHRNRQWQLDYKQIAREIEQHHPDLHAVLMTAVEQQPDPVTGKLNYLQERVIQQAI